MLGNREHSSTAVKMLSGSALSVIASLVAAITELSIPCAISSSASFSSMPYVTMPLAMAKRTKILMACSGRLNSARLPQVFTAPAAKNNTSRARPVACKVPWTV